MTKLAATIGPRKRLIHLIKSIYFARAITSGTQLLIVFYLFSQSHEALGTYSFVTAILAVVLQIVQFEGAHLVIAGVMSNSDMQRCAKTLNFLWSIAVLGCFAATTHTLAASAFILAFALNLGAEWLINCRTALHRHRGKDFLFKRLLYRKIIWIDNLIPIILVAYFSIAGGNLIANALINICLLILFLFVATTIGFVAPRNASLPKLKFLYSVTAKRIDSMFIRLFSGYFIGLAALGAVQPLFSIARLLNMLTPTWLNLNFGKRIRLSGSDRVALKPMLMVAVLLYIGYSIFAGLLYMGVSIIPNFEYSFSLLLLVVFHFGNQNTRAFLRSLQIVQNKIDHGNVIISVGLGCKIMGSLILIQWGIVGVLLSCLVIDFLSILVGTLIAWRSAELEVKP